MDKPAQPALAVHPVVRARLVILLAFGLLLAWLIPGIGKLAHDDDVLAFLPPEHPDVVAFRDVAERFGMLSVGLVGLRKGGDDLLRPESTEEIRELAIGVSELPGVRLVLSYPELPDARVEGDTLVVEPLVPRDLSDATEIRRRVLGNGNAVGNLVSEDGTAAALMIYFLDDSDASARGEQLDAIKALVQEQWGGQAWFGGAPFIESHAASASRQDIERLSPIVIAVLAAASAILLGSLTGAALNLVVTGLGVAVVVGAHGQFGEPFTIVSGTTPVMMVALGGAFGMHVISGYQRQQGTPRQRAGQTLRELWLPVVLSGVTTATAFFALLVMPQEPMQRFGVVAGFGVLLLLVLALLVLPALLSILPARLLRHRPARHLPLRRLPPLGLLLAVAAIGGVLGARLQADPDTRNVFDEGSEPQQADRFFNDNFGGSQFVQIAIEGDLSEPAVLREIRRLVERIERVPGVTDVRSLLEPVALLTEGFGGRRGIPQTSGRARRVVTNLADQSPMAQLMTTDSQGAIVHAKLGELEAEALMEATATIREAVSAASRDAIGVGSTREPEIARLQAQEVRERLSRLLDRELSHEEFAELLKLGTQSDPALRQEVEGLRGRALQTDELVIEPMPEAEVDALSVRELLTTPSSGYEALLRERVPTLVEKDPEGVKIVAEQLSMWVTEARERRSVDAMCEQLGLPREDPNAPPRSDPPSDPRADMFGEETPPPPSGPCGELAVIVSELGDDEWGGPADGSIPTLRTVPISMQVTGQPIIGQAFADSVTSSLRTSTLVSLLALGLVLLAARHLRALVPAVWTLAVTAGVVSVLGHPIGIGTSMVSCIALGAGVDFAIHLGIRARRSTTSVPGLAAVDELGAVILLTGVELALAFCVLLASQMPPLRQFGVGLAIALLLAAAGSVWFTPKLYRKRA